MNWRNVSWIGVAALAVFVSARELRGQANLNLDDLLKDISVPAADTGTAAVADGAAAAAPEADPVAAPAELEAPAAPETSPVQDQPAPEVAPEVTEVTFEQPAPAAVPEALVEAAPAPEAAPEAIPVPEVVPEVAPAAEATLPVMPEAPAAAPAETPVPVVEPMPEEPVAAPAPAAVEPEAAPAAAEVTPAAAPSEMVVLARESAEVERVRRQAAEEDGRKALADGRAGLLRREYAVAAGKFEEALRKLPVRAVTEMERREAQTGRAEAAYQMALAAFERQEYAEAAKQSGLAQQFDPDGYTRKHQALQGKISSREARASREAARVPDWDQRPETLSREEAVAAFMKEGKQLFEIEDYDRAEERFEQVLLKDPYQRDAMKFLKKIEERRFKASSVQLEATRADAMRSVRGSWNPPIRTVVQAPEQLNEGRAQQTSSSARQLQEKMQTMVIPTIEFRQANIVDVINYLRDASEAQDPEKAGVNIILNVEGSGPAAAETPAPAPTDDPWGAADAGATAAPAGGGMSGIPAITLNLRRVSLLDAIKYVTEIAGLKYRIEDRAVIITPANQASGTIVTRMYPVQPSILDVITTREEDTAQQQDRGTGNFVQMGAQTVTQKRSDARAFFEKAGVPFPAGSSITYNSSISQLIVANTAENLEIFERLLAQLNVIPSQIEIEARFVEIAQNDLEELGFQWFLTDNYEVATKKGGTLGGQQAVVMNANAAQGGFTKGLRYFDLSETGVAPAAPNGTAGMLGSLLSVSSILTNPELTVVLHALSQKGGVDLLSAPRVTTRSGVQAQIQVVREIIYPTEFETSEPTVAESGAMVSPPVVTPGSFETRETGVILNVTPTVGPDGYTIDLAMVPEVAELVDWIQYGSTINLDANRSFTFNIPQPVFASRNVQTSIVVWDGQTVVMGGLIREQMSRIKDKVPLLGDIPLLGRLFRSEGEYSQKQNLLIFVTARLVDPSGAPLRKGGESATISATTK